MSTLHERALRAQAARNAELGNVNRDEGVDRCADCGCKYWENDQCIDCGSIFAEGIEDDEWKELPTRRRDQ